MWCIGNGQIDQLKMSKMVGALNCMHDQQAILRGGYRGYGNYSKKTYAA